MKTLKEYLDAPGGREQLASDVDEILSWFDFKKIADVMDFLNWGWAISKDKSVDDLLDAGYRVIDEGAYDVYIPQEKDVILAAKRIIDQTVNHALDAEAEGDFTDYYYVDGAGFYCELKIIDDEFRTYFWGEDAPDDFEHSVDITLRFCIEESLGKFL